MSSSGLPVSEQELWDLAERVMTEHQFTAFWLRFHEDFEVGTIARAFRISRQAVDARLEGARRRLEKALSEQEAA